MKGIGWLPRSRTYSAKRLKQWEVEPEGSAAPAPYTLSAMPLAESLEGWAPPSSRQEDSTLSMSRLRLQIQRVYASERKAQRHWPAP